MIDPDKLDFNEYGRALLRWWLAARRPGEARVDRSALNPEDHLELLPFMMLQHWEKDELVFRLLGTHIDEWLGEPFTGRRLFDVTPEEDLAQIKQFYLGLRDQPCGAVICRNAVREDGLRFEFWTFNLPLYDKAKDNHYMIGIGEAKMNFVAAQNYIKSLPREAGLRKMEYIDLGFGIPVDQTQLAG